MRKISLALVLALPAQAFASGGEVLTLLWLEFALLVAVAVSLIFSKMPFRYRMVIFFAYCLGQAVAFGIVGGLPYVENRLVVDLVSVSVPLTFWLAALVISKRSCKPNSNVGPHIEMRKKMLWVGALGVLAICAYAYFKSWEKDYQLSFLPKGLAPSKVLYVKEESLGFGPGGNETGVIVYELPEGVSNGIQQVGIDYLTRMPRQNKADRDWRGIYEHWQPTPILVEGTDSSMNRVMSHNIADYLDRYGFGIEIDPQINQEINNAISTPGSFAAYGRIGLIIVIPKVNKVVYVYNG